MTQYSNDFSAVTVSANVPSGFTAHSDHSSVTWSVQDIVGAFGGKVLRAVSTNATKRAWLEWNTISSDSNKANQEILFRGRMNNAADTTGPAIIMRGDSAAATNSETGYVMRLAGSGVAYRGINIAEYNTGTISAPSARYAALTWSADEWVWVRCRINGTSLQVKAWLGDFADEPGSWGYTLTDSSISTGTIGPWLVGSHTVEWDVLNVGTNGDVAPAPSITLYSATATSIAQTSATIGCSSISAHGTLYYYVSTSATPPSKANMVSGSGAVKYGSAAAAVGANTFSVTGLSASTTYYRYFYQSGTAYDSAVFEGGSFATLAASGPSLSSPTATSVTQTAATVGCTSDSTLGTLYVVVTRSATSPTATQIKTGKNELGADAAAVPTPDSSVTAGANTFSVTGLQPSLNYWAHFIQNDGSTDSNIVYVAFTTAAAPVLSAATATSIGQTTATVGCSTDDTAGTMWVVVTQSATYPSAQQVKDHKDHLGSVVSSGLYGSDASITSPQTFAITGLSPNTAYYAYFVQNDGESDSNVLQRSFTTATAVNPGVRVTLRDIDSGQLDNTVTYAKVVVVNSTTLATIVTMTNQTGDAVGVLTLDSASFTEGMLGDTVWIAGWNSTGTRRFHGDAVVVDLDA